MSAKKNATTGSDTESERDAQDAPPPPEIAEPDWLTESYLGPLTADQAAARLARHGHHVTKPAAEPETK
jgi:hypothetical protein